MTYWYTIAITIRHSLLSIREMSSQVVRHTFQLRVVQTRQSYHGQAFKVLDYVYDLFKKLWRRWATFDVLWCSLSVWACQCQDGVVCSYSPADKALFVLGQLLLVTFSRTLHPNLREIFVRFYKLIGLSWGSRGPTWLLASELAFLSEPSRHVCSWRED